MSLKSSLNKVSKWIILLLLFFVLIAVAFYFLAAPIVKNRLEEQVFNQTAGAYTLTIDNLDINLFLGNVSAHSISLNPDSLRISKNKIHRDFYEIKAPEISITGLNVWQLIFNNQLSVDKLDIIKPEVRWVRNFDKDFKSDSEVGKENNKKMLPPVKIGIINLNESSLLITNNASKTSIISFQKASLKVDNFLWNSDTTKNIERKINYDDLTILVKDYRMKLGDSLNTFHFDSLRGSVKHSTLVVNGMEFQPRYGREEYNQRKGEETDRIEFYNKEISLRGIDFEKLKEEDKVIARLIVIDSINMVVYRDKTNPVKNNARKLLIQEQIRNAPIFLRIDSLQLNNTQITYQEKVEEGTEPGHINFINLSASVSNITNDSVLLKSGPSMQAHATTYVMGAGKIDAYFDFPIGNLENSHSLYGTVSPMELNVINPMLSNVAFAEIQSGKLNDMSFEARLNEDNSNGTMEFRYENLKVNILNKDEEESKKGLVSFLANTFVIKSNNPANGDFREGDMSFSRDKSKSMINYWWKTLLSGIKDTIGVPSKEAKE